MARRTLVPLVFILLVAAGSLAAVISTGTHPILGLDLQGGASVVLQPRGANITKGTITQAVEIIRSRVDALGVAEPEITTQGQNIVVQLPGVKNPERAFDIIGTTAELRFRPVLQTLPPENPNTTTTTTTAAPTTTTAAGAPSTTAVPSTTTAPAPGTTPRDQDKPGATVVLPEVDANGDVVVRYVLGPTELTGRAIKTATASPPQPGQAGWAVTFETTAKGRGQFAALSQKYTGKQVAIVLDGVVKSAPTFRSVIDNGRGEISGGGQAGFSSREAKDLALVLRYGALPVELQRQEIRSVSATLGKDSLRAGIISGVVGLTLVFLYMILYYRALGIVVLAGLLVSGALMWSIVSALGRTAGLTLSLAGAVGIIVSVGVTVDSYIVYFERLKDEVRSGKTIRSSVDRGFTRAFRTILAADASSFIGAALLYFLTVGAVRGFAFFLGLSTVLDVAVAWFFTRPMVSLVGRSRTFTEARFLGVARGLAIESGSPA